MKDDFDNGMGLPEDEPTGSASMSDPGDRGLGGMEVEDETDSEAPGRPSGGVRARSSSGSRPRGPAAAPAAKKSARKPVRKPARKAGKKAARGRKQKPGRRR